MRDHRSLQLFALQIIFMCRSASEGTSLYLQWISLSSSYLACSGRLTVKCNYSLLKRQMLSNLLKQFTKEVVETNQAFGCQESLGDCSQSLAWSMLEVLETHHAPGDSAGSTVTALSLLL